MDTEPGGEQTQYEGAHTFIQPHNKQAGQMGGTLSPILSDSTTLSLHNLLHAPSHLYSPPTNLRYTYPFAQTDLTFSL